MSTDLVVAGQVWQAPNGAMSVVVAIEAPDNDHENAVYATLIDFYDDGLLGGHQRITCDKLRGSAKLIYDATLTQPWIKERTPEPDYVHEAIVAIDCVQKSRVWFEPHSDLLDTILEAKDALQVLAGYDAVTEAGGNPMLVRNKKFRPS